MQRTRTHRLLFLVAVAAIAAPIFSARAQDSAPQRLDEVERSIAAERERLAEATRRADALAREVTEIRAEQIQAALDGAHKLPTRFPGITRVWTKTVKAQGERTHAIVMEFTGEQALKEYAGSDAQKEWYKVYEGIRERSTTFDITN